MTRDASLTASMLEHVVEAPASASGASRRGEGLAAQRSPGDVMNRGAELMSPRAMAPPIAPAPMMATFMLLCYKNEIPQNYSFLLRNQSGNDGAGVETAVVLAAKEVSIYMYANVDGYIYGSAL